MGLKHAIPLFLLLLCGCAREQLDDCVTSTGAMREEERSLAAFDVVELDDRIDLVLEQRPVGTVMVEAGVNLLGQVETEVVDGTLKVYHTMKCNWVRSFKPRITVHVPVAGLRHMMLRGTGDITCIDSLVTDYFLLEQWGGEGSTSLLVRATRIDVAMHTGAGSISLRGRSVLAELYSGIMAPIDARGLQADVVNLNNSGVADIRCSALNELNVQIRGVGDVYYSGDPATLRTEITGSGRLYRE